MTSNKSHLVALGLAIGLCGCDAETKSDKESRLAATDQASSEPDPVYDPSQSARAHAGRYIDDQLLESLDIDVQELEGDDQLNPNLAAILRECAANPECDPAEEIKKLPEELRQPATAAVAEFKASGTGPIATASSSFDVCAYMKQLGHACSYGQGSEAVAGREAVGGTAGSSGSNQGVRTD